MSNINWLSWWLTFKLLGITYLIGKIKCKLSFHGPLAEQVNPCKEDLQKDGSFSVFKLCLTGTGTCSLNISLSESPTYFLPSSLLSQAYPQMKHRYYTYFLAVPCSYANLLPVSLATMQLHRWLHLWNPNFPNLPIFMSYSCPVLLHFILSPSLGTPGNFWSKRESFWSHVVTMCCCGILCSKGLRLTKLQGFRHVSGSKRWSFEKHDFMIPHVRQRFHQHALIANCPAKSCKGSLHVETNSLVECFPP